MKTIDLDSPLPEQREEVKNAQQAWQLRRHQRLASADEYNSQDWLNDSICGLRLAMQSSDPKLTTLCLDECLAFACASVVGTAMNAVSLRVKLVGEVEFECKHFDCLPSQWFDSLLAAIIADDEPKFSLLSAALFENLDNEGEAFSEVAGRAIIALAANLDGTPEALEHAATMAESGREKQIVRALESIRQGSAIEYEHLDGLESLALSSLLSWIKHDHKNPRESLAVRGTAPEITCLLPVKSILHNREPHWFLDLHGYTRSGRQHSLKAAEKNRLLATYEVAPAADMPGIVAPFELVDKDRNADFEFALDAGELMFLSEWYVEQSEKSDDGRRYYLEEAIETVNAILLRLPDDKDLITADSIRSELGRDLYYSAPDRFERRSLETLLKAYRQRLEGAGDFDSKPGADQNAALAIIEILKEQISPLLNGLGRDRDGEIIRNLLPRPDDYGKAFVGDAIEIARKGYRDLSAGDMRYPSPDQSQLICHLAPAGMLGHENELSRHFPGGYQSVTKFLNPHRVWVRWKYVRPGESTGMAYDGLVWLDDHWAWFPKPYRVLAELVKVKEEGK